MSSVPFPGGLYTGPRFAAGSSLVSPLTDVLQIEVEERVDQDHSARISAWDGAAWLEDLQAGQVIALQSDGSEWIVIGDSRRLGDGVRDLELAPLHEILLHAGPVVRSVAGGLEQSSIGVVRLSARNLWNSFLAPHLTRRGLTHVVRGTFDSDGLTVPLSIAWEHQSALEIVRRLADLTDLEWRLRPDEGEEEYALDLITQIGSDVGEVWLQEGVNLLDLMTERVRAGLATIIRPHGITPQGDTQAATMGFSAWEVTDRTGSVITVAPVDGVGAGPILEDDQFVGRHLAMDSPSALPIDGGVVQLFAEITATEAPDKITVGEHSGSFAVGDHVMIVGNVTANANDIQVAELLTEVESPSGVSLHGEITEPLPTDLREERNYVKNPVLRNWTDRVVVEPGQASGSQSSTTSLNVKNFEPNITLPEGSHVVRGDGETSSFSGGRLTADATIDGSGNGTLQLSRSLSVLNDDAVHVFVFPPNAPDLWSWLATAENTLVVTRELGLDSPNDANAVCDGYSTAGATGEPTIQLSGLVPGDIIEPGIVIDVDGETATSTRRMVLSRAVVDGAGEAEVVASPQNAAISAATPVSFLLPTRHPSAGRHEIGLYRPTSLGSEWAARTSNYRVPHIESRTSLWSRMGIRLQGWVNTSVDSGESPKLRLWDIDDSSSLAEVRLVPAGEDPISIAALAEQTHTIAVQHTVTPEVGGTNRFRLEIDAGEGVWTWIPWVSSMLTVDPQAPPIEGSHGTRMHQRANQELSRSRTWPTTYEAEAGEWADRLNLHPTTPALELGATVRVRAETQGTTEQLRVMASRRVRTLSEEGGDEVVILTLATLPRLLSADVAEARARALRVDVRVEVDAETLEDRKEVVARQTPEPEFPGALRAFVLPGEDPPDNDDPVEVKEFDG